MSTLLFWKEWPKIHRLFYLSLWVIFFLSIFVFIYVYFQGSDFISQWLVLEELDLSKAKIGEVKVGMFSLPLEGQLYLSGSSYDAAYFQLPIWVYPIYGLVLALMGVLILTILSTLRPLWFAGGMTIFIFYLSTLNMDYVISWGNYTQIFLIISLVTYIGLSYYLNAYLKNIGFGVRFLAFLVLSLVLGTILMLFSSVKNPVIYLINYGALIPVMLTLLFITITAHDIVRTFFYLITRYNPQGAQSNLIHFSIITLFYLVNLVLIHLKQREIFVLDIYYLNVYWLFIIGAILGVWGYQQRQVLIQHILPFDYQTAFGYICLAILSFATITFYFVTSNDAMTDVFQDFILFSYIAYGFTFYIYIMSNFADLMRQGVDVNGFVYEGKIIPLNLLRYFGLVIILGFFLNVKQIMYYQAISGYYNGIGDIYFYHKDYRLAERYYTQALYNDFLNHRSNFALASLAHLDKDEPEELKFLKTAIKRQPSEFAYIKMGNLLLRNDKKIDALFALRQGLETFPKSPFLLNNLALLYKTNQVADSTVYYLEQAQQFSRSPIPQNNLWAFLTEKTAGDSLPNQLPTLDPQSLDLSGKINVLALYTQNQQALVFKDFPKPYFPKIDAQQFAFLHNLSFNQMQSGDTAIQALFREFITKDKSLQFGHQTQFLQACFAYYSGKVYDGIQLLASIPVLPSDGYYNTILGLWLLEQKAYSGAISYLDKAIALENTLAPFYKAIALSESHRFEEAIPLWVNLANARKKSPETAQYAEIILKVFKDSLALDNDVDKYNFLHYKKHLISLDTQREVYNAIENPNYRVKAGVELAQYYLEQDSIAPAAAFVENINAIQVNDAFIASQKNLVNLQIALKNGLYEDLLKNLDRVKLVPLHRNQLAFIRAKALQSLKRNKESEKYYLLALQASPFEEETVLHSAAFFEKIKKDKQKAYDILVNSVRSNPFSLKVYKAYALICPQVGLDYYGESALESIRTLTNQEDYQNFVKYYEDQKNKSRSLP